MFAFSVVAGDCPPLLSRPTCSALSAVFDCQKHAISSIKLKVKNYGLRQTESGHYMMKIGEFDSEVMPWQPPSDFSMKSGEEVFIVPTEKVPALEFSDQARECQVVVQPVAHGLGRQRPSPGPLSVSSLRSFRTPEPVMSRDDGASPGGRVDPGARENESRSGGLDVTSVFGKSGQRSCSVGDGASFTEELREEGRGMAAASEFTASEQGSSYEGTESSELGERKDDRVLRHRGHRDPAHSGGERSHSEEAREAGSQCSEPCPTESADRDSGRLSDVVSEVESRVSPQCGMQCESQDGDFPVEEVNMAASSQGGMGEELSEQTLEEESSLAEHDAYQADRFSLWPSGSGETEDAKPGDSGAHVKREMPAGVYERKIIRGILHEGDPRHYLREKFKEKSAGTSTANFNTPNDFELPNDLEHERRGCI